MDRGEGTLPLVSEPPSLSHWSDVGLSPVPMSIVTTDTADSHPTPDGSVTKFLRL